MCISMTAECLSSEHMEAIDSKPLNREHTIAIQSCMGCVKTVPVLARKMEDLSFHR
jgi:hypothetical protein